MESSARRTFDPCVPSSFRASSFRPMGVPRNFLGRYGTWRKCHSPAYRVAPMPRTSESCAPTSNHATFLRQHPCVPSRDRAIKLRARMLLTKSSRAQHSSRSSPSLPTRRIFAVHEKFFVDFRFRFSYSRALAILRCATRAQKKFLRKCIFRFALSAECASISLSTRDVDNATQTQKRETRQ